MTERPDDVKPRLHGRPGSRLGRGIRHVLGRHTDAGAGPHGCAEAAGGDQLAARDVLEAREDDNVTS